LSDNKFTETTVEEALLKWANQIGLSVLQGPEIAPGEPADERDSYREASLVGRLREV